MANTVAGTHLAGTHAARPAGNAVPDGSLYSCSDHSLVYLSSYAGNSWSTWASLAGTGIAASLADNAGDLLVASANDTWAKLATPTVNGQALQRVAGSVAWALPPGHEFDYVEKTSDTSITATAEASANAIVTGNAVTYDGSTPILIEFFCNYVGQAAADTSFQVFLYDGTSIGRLALVTNPTATGYTGNFRTQIKATRRLTPTAGAHTYSVRATTSSGTATVGGGAGGSGNQMPAYIRQTKV